MKKLILFYGLLFFAKFTTATTTIFDGIKVNSLNGTPISTEGKFYWGDVTAYPNSLVASHDVYVIGGGNTFWGTSSGYNLFSFGGAGDYYYNSYCYIMGIDNGPSNYGVQFYFSFGEFNIGDVDSYCPTNFGRMNSFGYESFWSMNLGHFNSISMATSSQVFGKSNQVYGAHDSNALGSGNVIIKSDFDDYWLAARYLSVMGAGIKVTPVHSFESLCVIGINNNDIVSSGGMSQDNDPLLLIGNGINDSNYRSNALILKKNGSILVSHRGFSPPTQQTPTPVQPEVFVIEGSSFIRGKVIMTQRQGDVLMSDFGRTEDH